MHTKTETFDKAFDKEAQRLGVPRQAVIKVWLAERLQVGVRT